jgi:hypothetical protein
MMTGNKFRARADDCLREAKSAADPERRFAHLDLAQRWLRLAAQIDKIDPAAQCAAPLVPLVPLQGGHRQNQGGA